MSKKKSKAKPKTAKKKCERCKGPLEFMDGLSIRYDNCAVCVSCALKLVSHL